MKKLLLAACVLVAGATSAFAQKKGDIALGANVSYLTESSRVGFGGKAQYSLTDNFRLDGGITFFLPKEKVNTMEMALNAHYVIPVAESLSLYPLAGLNYLHTSATFGDITISQGKFGLNLGGGVSYKLSPSVAIGAEAKYILIENANTPSIGANIMFTL